MSFFWYDYETFGPRASVDRPVQFAGVRTDEELRVIGDPVVLYCRPAPDYLPRPEACLIHGMTPSDLLERGVTEAEFALQIHRELSKPATCAVGYNAMRFDHEVTRFLLYRNLRDPYGWHWRNGNSRWDVIDLLRGVFALRHGGIKWPARDDGGVSFRLEDLAAANGLRHESPHEAFADVRTTIDLARLVRETHGDLYDHALALRHKSEVAKVTSRPFLWVSSLLGVDRFCLTLMAPLAVHPTDANAVIAFDLSHDPTDWGALDPAGLREAIFQSGGPRSPIYKIKLNACPFVAPASWLTEEVRSRVGLDGERLKANYHILAQFDDLGSRLRSAYDRDLDWGDGDVDAALYDGFIPDGDRDILNSMLDADLSLAGAAEVIFEDGRMAELVFRYRARNYPDTLTPAEKDRWREHCRARHLEPGEGGRSAMEEYTSEIESLRASHPSESSAAAMLDDLAHYGRRLRRWLE